MKEQNKKKKWKVVIVSVWILFLVAASIGFLCLQRANVYKKAETELKNQAEIISGQFNNLVDTDFYARAVLYDRLIPEVKTISFVLENYDDIGQAKGFLEDIVNTTEVKNLWIYDRNGNVVFGSGDTPEDTLGPDEIAAILDSKAYELIEDKYSGDDRYLTTTYLLEDDSSGLLWGVGDRWLIYAENPYSDKLQNVVQFFDWDHVLQDISVARNGVVLAVSEIDGSVLSFSDSSFKGKPVEDLNIRISGKNDAVSVDQLSEAFSNKGEVTEIEVDSVPYYATRMDIDNDLFLVMFPVESIEKEVLPETVILMALVALVTGIGVLYVFCLAANESEQLKKNDENKGGSKLPVARVKVFTILAVILVFVISLYMETHLVYARMFQYTSTTAEDVLQKKDDADHMLKELQTWVQQGNLEKCRIARCAIQHAAAEKVDRQYVSDLADRLNVSSLYVFDEQGKVSCTNAPYDGFVIDGDSPFHVLLEGSEYVVYQPDQGEASGQVEQEAGVTMIDDSNRVEGAVVIADGTVSMLSDDLSYENVFQRAFLKDNTVVMAVDSENMTVRFFAQVDGSLLVSDRLSFDYTQTEIAALGIDENLIKDHFNGEMFAIENQYFASVRRNDSDFLMVLRPLVFLDAGTLLLVLYVTGVCLLFLILLICISGKIEIIPEEGSEEADEKKLKHSAVDNNADESTDDVFVLLGKLANTEKYEFEKRWPSDGKKWREKSPMEKFSTAVKLICIAVLALVAVYAAVAGENSVFYYVFNGEWSNGFNLYSLTSCIITIILLILLKEIIHKVLYLIARAAKSKGETICHLLNSFSGYILFIAGVFIILGILGVDLTTMSLTAGVTGVIFGIGCQNIVADILAGIIMAFEGIACAGDYVFYNGKMGVIQSIGVRTTKLKWYSEITLVRNNEFKNFVNMPAEETSRILINLSIDYKESLTRVESVIEKELPVIRDYISEKTGDNIKLKYRGVQGIEASWVSLSFAVYCQGMYYGWVKRMLNRELLLMCERNDIEIALPQIVVNEHKDAHKASDDSSETDELKDS